MGTAGPHCQALVIHCIDYRFVAPLHAYLHTLRLEGRYDDVAMAGGIRDLVGDNETAKTYLLGQVEIACCLHGISEVYLVNHLDCGAYGGQSAFTDEQSETKQHCADLAEAEAVITATFCELKVHKLLGRIDRAGNISFEAIA